MFDLNAIVNAAINAAVEARITEVLQQHANTVGALAERIAALERTCATQHEAMVAMRDRIAVLENNPAQGVDMTLEQRVAALESETQGENRYLNRYDVAELIAEAMDEHTSNYDHDDYDNHIGDDDKHFDGDIEDAVRDALSNMTFDVSIR